MKKLLFTALVAIVAVGGALTANATTWFTQDPDGSGPLVGSPIDCNGTNISCVSFLGSAYTTSSYPNQVLATEEQLEETFRN